MNRLLSTIASLLVVTAFTGCATDSLNDKSPPVVVHLSDIATGPSQTRPAMLEVDGKPMILYSTKAGRVALQSQDKTVLLDETARVKEGGSYFQLNAQGKNIQALWWSHQSGKNIYLASSEDGGKTFAPVSMANDEHGVLPPFSLVSGPDRKLGLIYHDERLPNYQAFFNTSIDLGKTWSRPDIRLDSPPEGGRSSDVHEPQLIQAGSVWLSAWTDNIRGNGQPNYRVVSRRSTDNGATWSPATVLYESDHHISALVFRAFGNTIVGAADETGRGVFAVASTDKGATWIKVGTVEGTKGGNNSGIEIAESSGRVNAVWIRDDEGKKSSILQAAVDTQASKWVGPAIRLDVKAFDNTRSTSPSLIADAKGRLIAAWVDFRDIRTNIYLSSSTDRGQTWTAPAPLLNPGNIATGWPTLFAWQDGAALGYETYPTDVLAAGKFNIQVLTFADNGQTLNGLAAPNAISDAAKKARLEARIKSLWDSRVAADYASAFEMFDFAYKAATPKKVYLDGAGVITYLGYSVDTMLVTGNEANVNMKVKYEVKPTVIPMTGKPISLPPFDSETPTRWVWVANDWYLVYTPSFDPPVLKY